MAIAFVAVTLALLAYTYFGYPIADRPLRAPAPGASGATRTRQTCHSPSITRLPAGLQRRLVPAGEDREPARAGLPDREHRDPRSTATAAPTTPRRSRARSRRRARGARARARAASRRAARQADRAQHAWRRRPRGELLLMNDVRQPLSRGALRALARAHATIRASAAPPGTWCWTGAGGQRRLLALRELDPRAGVAFRGVVGMTGPHRDDAARRLRAAARRSDPRRRLDPDAPRAARQARRLRRRGRGPRRGLRGRPRVQAQGAHAGGQLSALRACFLRF